MREERACSFSLGVLCLSVVVLCMSVSCLFLSVCRVGLRSVILAYQLCNTLSKMLNNLLDNLIHFCEPQPSNR